MAARGGHLWITLLFEFGNAESKVTSRTKVASPQTDGICKQFHKTILQGFYQVTFRKKIDVGIKPLFSKKVNGARR
jgi:hypothetical protein